MDMQNKKTRNIVILIIIVSVIAAAILYFKNFSCSSNNAVTGTYREDYLSITLYNNNTFKFYNAMAGTSAEGKYTYNASENGKTAKIGLKVNSGLCSYDGAVIYFYEGSTRLIPTINGKEIVARMMTKVN